MSGQTAESPTTCSGSGFCSLGEPPCIYTLVWLAEPAAVLTREPPIQKHRNPVAQGRPTS